MKDQPRSVILRKDHVVTAKIGNPADCNKAMSAAIEKRAYEIYQSQGCCPGHDEENWRLAEREILQPLTCVILKSKAKDIFEVSPATLGAEGMDEIEVCVEPHRLILVGKRGSGTKSGEGTNIYRVVTLKEQFDPSSAKFRQGGSLPEIEVCKSEVNENTAAVDQK